MDLSSGHGRALARYSMLVVDGVAGDECEQPGKFAGKRAKLLSRGEVTQFIPNHVAAA